MCKSKAEGGTRCDCDSSKKRRLRRHNREALNRVAESLPTTPPPFSPAPPAAPVFVTQPTDEDVRQKITEVHELREQWVCSDLDTLEKQKLADAIEEKSTYVGAMISSIVDYETGETDAQNSAQFLRRWKSLEAQVEEAVNEVNEAEKEYSNALLNEPDSLLTKQKESALTASQSWLEGRREELKQEEKKLFVEQFDNGSKRGEEILKVLKRFRNFGGEINTKKFKLRSKYDDKKIFEDFKQSVEYFPSEWIEAQNSEKKPLVVFGYMRFPDHNTLGWYDKNGVERTEVFLSGNYKIPFRKKITDYEYLAIENGDPGGYNSYYQKNQRATMIHEISHRMESIQGNLIAALEGAFLERRITDSTGLREASVNTAVGSEKSVVNYNGYRDNFTDIYSGYDYRPTADHNHRGENDAWEILSTGTGAIFGGKNNGLMENSQTGADPDFKNFVIGIWASI